MYRVRFSALSKLRVGLKLAFSCYNIAVVNTARRTLYVWVVLTILFFFGIFAPSIFGMDGFNGGFAIAFVCIVLSITGSIVVAMYATRARQADAILKGRDVLAHWSYSAADWQGYADKDYTMERQDKWALYRVVMVITAVVVFGFWLFHRDSGSLMIGIFFGLGLLLAGVIWITTTYDHRQNLKYQGEVYITRDGAYVGRKLHLWKGWGASIDDVSLDEPNRLLLITYSMPSRTGRDNATARILVPQGQDDRAREIAANLAAANGLTPGGL
jgi:hypothetical protein